MITGFDLCRAAVAVVDITAPEQSVLLVLAIMANDDAQCWPPINGDTGLTGKTKLSERAVQRAIQRLKDLGHISRRQLRHGCVYTVHPQSTPATVTPDCVTGDTVAGVSETGDTQAPRPASVAPKQPVTTIPPEATPPSEARAKRGGRLPEGWRPEALDPGTVAGQIIGRRGEEWERRTLESFENHWRAATGRNAVKLDWQRAWANWVIEQDNRDGRRGPQTGLARDRGVRGARPDPSVDLYNAAIAAEEAERAASGGADSERTWLSLPPAGAG